MKHKTILPALLLMGGAGFLAYKLLKKHKSNASPFGGLNTGLPTGAVLADSSSENSNVPTLATPTYIVPTNISSSVDLSSLLGLNKSFRVTANKLNIRDNPGITAAIIGSLNNGQIIKGKLLPNGWVQTNFNNNIGYVSASFLSAL